MTSLLRFAPTVPFGLLLCIAGCDGSAPDAADGNDAGTADVAATDVDQPESGATDTASGADAPADTGVDDGSGDDAASPDLPTEWLASADDFGCLTEWQSVRGFWMTNVLGLEDEAVRIAEAGFLEAVPPGTILQLVPQEAMAKLLPGTRPETGDWEYFLLTPEETGTAIVQRGGAEVTNPAGSCMSCHAGAASRDFICEDSGLCAAAAVPRTLVDALVAGDPRCN